MKDLFFVRVILLDNSLSLNDILELHLVSAKKKLHLFEKYTKSRKIISTLLFFKGFPSIILILKLNINPCGRVLKAFSISESFLSYPPIFCHRY